MRTVGVEEELILVDPDTGEPRAVSGAVLALTPGSGLEQELQLEQLEVATRPSSAMSELSGEIKRWRAEAARRAAKVGAVPVALATSPLPVHPSLTSSKRYRWMREEFALTAQEQLTCGCHIHVSVESDEEGVGVLDRIRPWLAPLMALSGNSPFWQGRDTGYSSYRSRVWGRWPSAGPVEIFGSAERYRQQVRAMLDTGALLDEGMIYFDARLSRHYPTVEVRVADVCLEAEDTVLLAMLVRALVETAADEWRAGQPPDPAGIGLLRLALWRAGRSGLDAHLVQPLLWTPAPAQTVLRSLLDHAREALDEAGDLESAEGHLAELLERGSGARRQREVFKRTGALRAVVKDCATRTVAQS
ncbi:glutamate--cysteine ligase [Streptomyces spongiae]|uniref:Putative glutamate--cysteine ligase 2 n=1 Tax=Streptomyces spongiae TaxID=565072 RepID=A0A5N8XEP3_9ACTN|nr:glutamate--cysteine ligase [Streptomyces spongiae]MPY58000.1 YbdK family carboxylate-amine ligase [Streptomyces spongiae]